MQEGEYINKLRLKEGFNISSPNNGLRIWSNNPIVILKNSDHIQIVETTAKKKKVFVINVHLDTKKSRRRHQIDELTADIQHLEHSYDETNTICVGDFNCERPELTSLTLKFQSPDVPTWRRSKREQFTSKLDRARHQYR